MSTSARPTVMGIPIDALDEDASVRRCLELVETRGHQHVSVNAAKLIMAHDDPNLMRIIRSCSLVNADGQSVVWASRMLGRPIPARVAGIDLMNRIVDAAAKQRLRIYLLGARPEVVEATAEDFIRRGAHVVGYRDGYWADADEAQVVAQIAETAPDVLFLAIPSPRKEFFLARWLPDLNTGLAFGVGGSFDVVAGVTKRAPVAAQRLGLEWMYRLLQEPRRMFKRYLVGNTRFIVLALRYRVRGRRKL